MATCKKGIPTSFYLRDAHTCQCVEVLLLDDVCRPSYRGRPQRETVMDVRRRRVVMMVHTIERSNRDIKLKISIIIDGGGGGVTR